MQPDLTVDGFPGVYVIGDVANIPSPDGLVASAARLGRAAEWGSRRRTTCWPTSRASRARAFHYHDKGIMAMIGRGAAVAEVGAHRHELRGVIAFSSWLGRARHADDGRAQPRRRLRQLGLGLLRQVAWPPRSSTARTPHGSTGKRMRPLSP